MGIEPTQDFVEPYTGFEDQGRQPGRLPPPLNVILEKSIKQTNDLLAISRAYHNDHFFPIKKCVIENSFAWTQFTRLPFLINVDSNLLAQYTVNILWMRTHDAERC